MTKNSFVVEVTFKWTQPCSHGHIMYLLHSAIVWINRRQYPGNNAVFKQQLMFSLKLGCLKWLEKGVNIYWILLIHQAKRTEIIWYKNRNRLANSFLISIPSWDLFDLLISKSSEFKISQTLFKTNQKKIAIVEQKILQRIETRIGKDKHYRDRIN